MTVRAMVEVRVEFVMTAEAGPFGGDWTLESVRKDGKREAEGAMRRLVELAAAANIQLRPLKIGDGFSLTFEPSKT